MLRFFELLGLRKRADEIQSLNAKVAYYCRLHAIEQGLQIPNRAPEIQDVLELLMEKLEQDKPLIATSDDDAALCEAFAVRVFKTADRQDREGKADAKTVRAFYAASIFIDVLEHFGELPQDMVERKQYAFWKAADIRKALREGRKPEPGPPAQEDDLGLDLPDIPGSKLPEPGMPPGSSVPGPGPASSSPKSSASLPDAPKISGLTAQQPTGRFRPGSKVFYNSPTGPPAKGTVVTALPNAHGIVYKVGLSAQVLDVPEAQLAHDFAAGERVLFVQRPNSMPQEATVERFDTSRWPIAYLVGLSDGSSEPTTEDKLSPAIKHEAAAAPTPWHDQNLAKHGPPAASGQDTTAMEHDSAAAELAQDPLERSSAVPGHQEGAVQHGPVAAGQDGVDMEHGSAATEHGRAAAEMHTPEGSASSSPRAEETASRAFQQEPYGPRGIDAHPADGLHNGSDGMDHEPRSTTPPEPDEALSPGHFDLGGPAADSALPRPSNGTEENRAAPPDSSYPGIFHGAPTGSGTLPQPPPAINPAPLQPPPDVGFRPPHRQPAMPPAQAHFPPSAGLGAVQPGLRRVPSDVGALPPPTPGYDPPLAAMTEAQRAAKNAVSAISFEDVPTAVKNLQRALELLTVPGAHR